MLGAEAYDLAHGSRVTHSGRGKAHHREKLAEKCEQTAAYYGIAVWVASGVMVPREGEESFCQRIDLGVESRTLDERRARHLACEYRKKFGSQIGRNDEKAVFFGFLSNEVVNLIGKCDKYIARFEVSFLGVGISDRFTLKDLYYFDYSGVMVTNGTGYCETVAGWGQMYFGADGKAVKTAGWKQAENGWIYIGANGFLYNSGIYRIGGRDYSFYDCYWVQ